MADEKPPAEGDELILTPEDQVKEGADKPTEADDDRQPDEAPTIEALAQEMGWAPKEAFKGDPEKWKPADQFIRDGHEIQRTVGKELKSLRGQFETVAKTNAAILEQRLEEERAKLTERFNAAVEDGDSKTAFDVADRIKNLEAPKPAPLPESAAWAEKHANWFNKDPLATARAVEVSERLNRQGYSVADQLEAAERTVRKEFPEHFPTPAKRQAAVHESRRDGGQRSAKKGFADLPPEAQKVARSFLETAEIPLETYAANYWKQVEARRA